MQHKCAVPCGLLLIQHGAVVPAEPVDEDDDDEGEEEAEEPPPLSLGSFSCPVCGGLVARLCAARKHCRTGHEQAEALARSLVTRLLRVLLVSRFLLTRGRDGHGDTPGVGVALVGCPGGLVCFDNNTSLSPCVAQAGGLTLWVKRTDVPNARYTASLQVGAASTVDEFIARWVAERRLDMDPGLVSLRLVPDTGDKEEPTPADESRATVRRCDGATRAGSPSKTCGC